MGVLILAAALTAAAPLSPGPEDPVQVQARLLEGDVVTLERVLAARAARGEPVDVGPWAFLRDLSQLMRCRPLGPVPPHESPRLTAAREALRLERVRLQRRLRDGVHASGAFDALLGRPWVRDGVPEQPELVRWPAEAERWPGEIPDPRPPPSRCPSRLDGARDRGRGATARAAARARAERAQLAKLVPHLTALPDATASRLAFAYLADAERAGPEFRPSLAWLGRLEVALRRDRGPHRVAGQLALAKVLARSDGDEARRVLGAVLEDPARTPAQDSRARLLLVAELEPDWPRVIALVRGAQAPRASDRPALDNALARALYATGDRDGLMRFGRRFVQRARGGPFDAQTQDLLLMLGFELPVPEALAWVDEILPAAPRQREARLASLGRWALARGALDLAAALFDRLRLEAAAEIPTRGPKARAALARWLGLRAEVAYERGDPEAFGGLLEALVGSAAASRGQPLARHAPHRAVAALGQTLTGRLVERAGAPEQARFAGHLLEAVSALLAQEPGRWKKPLLALAPVLTELAGPYAAGRQPAAKAKRGGRPVRQLGEVVVPRLPPRLEPEDTPTAQPPIDDLGVHLAPGGRLAAGLPFAGPPTRRRGPAR